MIQLYRQTQGSLHLNLVGGEIALAAGSAVCRIALMVAAICSTSLLVEAQELSPKEKDLFEIHVRPTLTAHCIKCHGASKQEGDLRLTSLEDLLKGGASGPAIVPGKPNKSLLVEALRYESLEMPPEEPLAEELISGIEAWIAAGAPWPADAILKPTIKISDDDRQWWSLQPIADPAVPQVDDRGWCKNDIDRFVFARLAEEGIQPSAEAAPVVLARRAHFAITGLPPDDSTTAMIAQGELSYEGLIDRLLDEPAYGENQARFWLDLVRYAETDGYRADHGRKEAHLYRDYVIASFNEDKPYDRFVAEQLAGDEIDPGNRDALIGTMFLRHWIYEHNQRDVETQWHEILDDITETTADVFLASGLKCARCHDHKFDPFLQEDFFRMRAFFAAFQPREDMPVADLTTRAAFLEKEQAWEQATDDIRRHIRELEYPVLLKHATREGFDKFVEEIKSMILKRPDEREPYEHQIASLACRQFDVEPDKLAEWLDKPTEEKRQSLHKQLAEFDSLKPAPLPTIKFVASDVGPVAPATFIPDDPDKTPIEPGYPTVLDDQPAQITAPLPALQSTGRRTALAGWITSPDNPLTARVMVNRIWQQHFGRGLVETTSDFGRLGSPPSHPELLDWLASRFIEDGWSVKKLHRLILNSATWQQTSQRLADDHLKKLDLNNILLWRMNPRRLSAEEITDSILTASGELKSQKRAIYKPVKRNTPDPLLSLFDFPDRIRSMGQRHRTTTSTQALMLMNNKWAHDRAATLAGKLQSKDDQALLNDLYQQLFFRQPEPEEVALAQAFMHSLIDSHVVELSTAAALIATMPSGETAIDLRLKDPASVRIPYLDAFPRENFTVEAIVMPRSLYDDASVRTIAANWTGNKSHVGWALGMTSTKSAYKPKNLIFQLVGKNAKGDVEYEVVASNLRLELNKPFYVAASVNLKVNSKMGITFYLKDLSDPDAKMQTASVEHKVVSGIGNERDIEIGSRSSSHRWDGLVQNVRLYSAALSGQELNSQSSNELVFDISFDDQENPGADRSGNKHHATVQQKKARVNSPKQQARIALVHALLNSNELIYVD